MVDKRLAENPSKIGYLWENKLIMADVSVSIQRPKLQSPFYIVCTGKVHGVWLSASTIAYSTICTHSVNITHFICNQA